MLWQQKREDICITVAKDKNENGNNEVVNIYQERYEVDHNSKLVRVEKNNCYCMHVVCMKNAWKTLNMEMVK